MLGAGWAKGPSPVLRGRGRQLSSLLTQACRSFPTSSMLVESLESLHRSRAVISLGVNWGLAGPIFIKFLRFKDAFKSLSSEMPQSQEKTLSFNERSFLLLPQEEHFLELGKNLPATTRLFPYIRDLYSSCLLSS